MNSLEYDIDVFWEGDYFPVTATLYSHGRHTTMKDGAGQEWYEILSEPEFNNLVVYNPDTGDIMDDPMDGLVEQAREMLKEIYWNRELV